MTNVELHDAPTANRLEAIAAEAERLDRDVKRFRAVAQDCNRRLAEAFVFQPEHVDEESGARSAADRLARLAEQVFPVPIGTLRIDRCALPDLDPIDLWQWLTETYGGGKAAVLAYAPLAKEFVSALRVSREDEMRMVTGKFSFKKYIDCSKGGALDYHSARDLKIIMEGLITIATWAGIWGEEETKVMRALIAETNYLERMRRVRTEIGSSLLIVPCFSSWDFRLSPELAEKVQIFLSEHGAFA